MTIEQKIKALEGPILVFGASGFVGANLLEKILAIRKDCYAVTHNYRAAWRLKLLEISPENIVFCDISYKNSVKDVFDTYQAKTIFNLAAYGAYSKQNNTNLIYETNVVGLLNTLEACLQRNIKAYIHAGSSSEYGFNCENPQEDDKLLPNSHYAVSKVSANYLIKFYADVHQLPTLNLRLYSIYGAWEEPDRLIPRLIEKAQQGSLPPLVNPNISRDFVYIDDCIEAFLDAALQLKPAFYGESINIGTGQKTTLKELVDITISAFDLNLQAEWGSMPNRKWDLENWYGNYEKAQSSIGWQPKTSLKDGLQKYAQWQKNVGYQEKLLPFFENPAKLNKLSYIVACYKDEQAIPFMYERLVKASQKMNVQYEIIFVNDCSPDNTQEVVEDICGKDTNVIAITHSRNFGSQSAFSSGMEISSGDAVVLMDGDLQDPPEVIPAMYEKWLEGYEVVYGRRVKREMSQFMNFVYKFFYRIFSYLSYIKIPKDAGDFSVIDRKVVNELIKLPEKEQFLRGLRAWVGFKQIGVDYLRPERMFGVSTNNWYKNIGWAKKAIFSFSFFPLEVLSYTGFVITSLAFLGLLFQVIYKIIYPDIPHGITTIIVLILLFGGIQIMAISVIGEYIAKIFEETKGRPKFIRKSIIYKGKKIDSMAKNNTLFKNH